MSRSPAFNASAMTSPRTGPGQAAKVGRPFNPSAKYPVKLADRLRDSFDKGRQVVTRIEVDPEIKFTGNSVEATVEVDPIDPESALLVVTSKAENSKQEYKGALASETDLYTLTFDPTSQTLILDRIDATITFSTEQPASIGSDASASDSDDGTPDPDNPYDWRHQLNHRDSSPDDAGSVRSGPESFAGSPALAPRDFRKASTPPDSVYGEAMVRVGSRATAASTPARGGDDDLVFDFDVGDGDGGSDAPNRGRPPSKLGKRRGGPVQSLAQLAKSRSTSRQPLPVVPAPRSHAYDSGDEDDDVLEVQPEPSPAQRSTKSFSDHDVDVSDIDIDGPKSPSLASQRLESSPPPASVEHKHEHDELELDHGPEREAESDSEIALERGVGGSSQSQPQAQHKQHEPPVEIENENTFEDELMEAFNNPSSDEEVSEEE